VCGSACPDTLAALLSKCAEGLAGEGGKIAGLRPLGGGATPLRLTSAVALSALSLLAADRLARIRICPNCAWLFLDGSRNASRLWCDMAVCGNRQKARRHYRRRLGVRGDDHA